MLNGALFVGLTGLFVLLGITRELAPRCDRCSRRLPAQGAPCPAAGGRDHGVAEPS